MDYTGSVQMNITPSKPIRHFSLVIPPLITGRPPLPIIDIISEDATASLLTDRLTKFLHDAKTVGPERYIKMVLSHRTPRRVMIDSGANLLKAAARAFNNMTPEVESDTLFIRNTERMRGTLHKKRKFETLK